MSVDVEAVAAAAREVVEREAPVARFRAMRDANKTFDSELSALIAELGWHTVLDAEGLGLAGLAAILEALGKNLAPTPLVSVALCHRLAPQTVARGERVALAWEERGARGDPAAVSCRFERGTLTGHKVGVLDGTAATQLVVSAVDGREIGLFWTEGGERLPLVRLDHRDAADVRFDRVPAVRLDKSFEDLSRALDDGAIALSAEMLGGMQAALDLTLAWLKTRRQFGVPIGSFQALKHRAVDSWIAVELARAAVKAAADAPSPALASLAKAQCSEAFLAVAKEAVQLHGGIGMTDECDVGLYLKRAQVAALTLGDAAFHRDRWARLAGW